MKGWSGLLAFTAAALCVVVREIVWPATLSSTSPASELLLKAVPVPLGGSPILSGPASHPFYRTDAAAGAAERHQDTVVKGPATPFTAVVAKVAEAVKKANSPPRPSGNFLRHEVASAGKAAVKVAALAKSVIASDKASTHNKARLVRARIAKISLHTAMNIVEKGAAHALAQADKDAVEAALLRATLSVPGQRKAEKAAAAAAARAAANKPSAAWLAGAKSLADRNPYSAMHVYTPPQQLRQQGYKARKRGSGNALSRLRVLSPTAYPALTHNGHTGFSRDEAAAYKVHVGQHPIDLGGNDKLITTLPRNEEGGIDRPNPAQSEYVKKTRSLGTRVAPAEVQKHWAHGYYHPYSIVKQDDRYVAVGRLLTHRGGVTRREMKMPTAQEEDEGGVDTEEEQPPEEPEAEDCEWGKDVYGRCYTECTDGKDEYGKCHDGSPIWTDPMPLSKLCMGHENATWCQEPEGEQGPATEEDAAGKARTVKLASVGGAQAEALGGREENAANAPTLAGGIPVAGGKVVWLPLSALSDGAQGKGTVVATKRPETEIKRFVTASPAVVTPQVPKWDPKKFSKEVLYGPNGKPLYAFYARSDNAAAATTGQTGGQQKHKLHSRREGTASDRNFDKLSDADKEIERKVLFKLLKEEQEEAAQLREQKLAENSAGGRVAASSWWVASLLVSAAVFVAPILLLH